MCILLVLLLLLLWSKFNVGLLLSHVWIFSRWNFREPLHLIKKKKIIEKKNYLLNMYLIVCNTATITINHTNPIQSNQQQLKKTFTSLLSFYIHFYLAHKCSQTRIHTCTHKIRAFTVHYFFTRQNKIAHEYNN